MRTPKKVYAVLSVKNKGPIEEGDLVATKRRAEEVKEDRNSLFEDDPDWGHDWRIVTYIREDLTQ